MIVAAHNPETADLEKTYLSSRAEIDATSLEVKNNDTFAVGDKILVGEMGGEQSEIRTVSAVAADRLGITVDALDFDHAADTAIYRLEFDQIRFYRRTSATGTPVLMTTSDIDVDNTDKVTRWDDTTSATTYYYQTSYYHSGTDEETELSDPIPATGYTGQTAGSIIDAVIRRVRDTGYTVLGFEEYIDIMNEVGDDLITQSRKPYTFLRRTVALDAVADQEYIDLPADFWKFDHVSLAYISAGQTRYRQRNPLSLEMFQQRYDSSNALSQANITDTALDIENSRLMVYPTPPANVTGALKLTYFKTFDEITTAGDTIETPNSLIYRYKLMSEFYYAKSEVDAQWTRLGQKYEEKYGAEIVKMQRTNRRDAGTPRSMRPPRLRRRRRYHL